MTTKATINIRLDETLKAEFEAICSDLGLSMTAAFNMFVKAVCKRRGIPFRLTATPENGRDTERGHGVNIPLKIAENGTVKIGS